MQFSALLTAALAATVSAAAFRDEYHTNGSPVQCRDLTRYCGSTLRSHGEQFVQQLKQESKTDLKSIVNPYVVNNDFDNILFCNTATGLLSPPNYRPVGICSKCSSTIIPGTGRCDANLKTTTTSEMFEEF